jgi:hypothetical protein
MIDSSNPHKYWLRNQVLYDHVRLVRTEGSISLPVEGAPGWVEAQEHRTASPVRR